MSKLIGRTFGEYRIEERLSAGRGSTGQVFRAVHLSSGREVALKFLSQDLVEHPQSYARFRDEYDAIQRLDHPHIIKVIDWGEHDDQVYMVMEYMPDASFQDLLDQRSTQEWPLSLGLSLICQAAAGLTAIHGCSMVHRDIKPANLLLRRLQPADPADQHLLEQTSYGLDPAVLGSERYLLKVSDFGLVLRDDENLGRRSSYGAVLGTPQYMAPEQCLGSKKGPIDGRCDIYALGVVLYQIATGSLPFLIRDLGEAINMHPSVAPPLPSSLKPDIPIALEAIILRCLAKHPDDRYASAAELESALVQFLRDAVPDDLGQPVPLEQELPETRNADWIGLLVEAGKERLTLTPGQPVGVNVTIANLHPNMTAHFDLSVEGVPATWVKAPDQKVKLNPRESQTLALTIDVPRSPESRAGEYPVTIRATSQSEGLDMRAQEVRWTVRPFSGSSLSIEPPTTVVARRRASYILTLHNDGNTPTEYTLRGEDKEGALDYLFDYEGAALNPQQPFRLEPGQVTEVSRTVIMKVTARRRRWLGRHAPHPIAITMECGGEQSRNSVDFVQRAVIPAWAVTLAMLFVALVAFIAFSPPVFLDIQSPTTAAANAPVTVSWRALNAGNYVLRDKQGPDEVIPAAGLTAWLGQTVHNGEVGGFPVTTTVELIAYNLFGLRTVTSTVVIGVDYDQPFIENFSANAETITYGDSLTVTLRVQNADQLTLNPGSITIPVALDGLTTATLVLTPTSNITYSLLATTGQSGEKRDDEEFSVVVTPKIERFVVVTPPNGLVAGAQPNVRVEWKVAGATSVDIVIDGRVFKTVSAREGVEEIPAPPADAKITLRAQRRDEAEASETISLAVRAPECIVTRRAGLHRAPFDDGTVFRTLNAGQKLVPLERNREASWLWAEVPGEGRAGRGWVNLEALDCNLPEDVLRIAEVVPTARPTPDLAATETYVAVQATGTQAALSQTIQARTAVAKNDQANAAAASTAAAAAATAAALQTSAANSNDATQTALVQMVTAAAQTQTAAAAPLAVQLTIDTVTSIDNPDATVSGSPLPEYYAIVFMGGERFEFPGEIRGLTIYPDWRFQKSTLQGNRAMIIEIELWDADYARDQTDRHQRMDIFPHEGRTLRLSLDLDSCAITGIDSDFFGACGMTLTSAGDEVPRARIDFQITVVRLLS